MQISDVTRSDREPAGPARGVVELPAQASSDDAFEHRRVLPGAALSPFVAHYWWVRWDLSGSPPRSAATLPHPCIHWVVEQPDLRGEVVGVLRRRFVRTLSGRGSVFGIKFRPGTYRAFSGADPHALTDHRVALLEHATPEGRAWLSALAPAFDDGRAAALADEMLSRNLPELPSDVVAVRDLVEELERDQSLVRAEQAAERLGVPMRTLERRFRRHVGVSPKWVIRRYRLIEAVEALKHAPPGGLASLAMRLGYSDQAHFTRDFKSLTGVAPGAMGHRNSK